jgi:hypothetical protein
VVLKFADEERAVKCDLLTSTLNGFGIRRDGDALLVRATPKDFSLRKHNLVQAILDAPSRPAVFHTAALKTPGRPVVCLR